MTSRQLAGDPDEGVRKRLGSFRLHAARVPQLRLLAATVTSLSVLNLCT
jgi:hypothetical protein